ncbi:hypothetical protein D3C81_650150 [compost metagenome]
MIQRLFPRRQIPMLWDVMRSRRQLLPDSLAEQELKAGAPPSGEGTELFPRAAVSLPDVGWADRSAARYGRG